MPIKASPLFAYLSDQQVHVVRDDGASEPVTSKFVEEVRRREASIQRKSAWKTQGAGARFMGGAALWDESAARRQPAFFQCVAPGRRPGEILYALTTGIVSGLFAYDVGSGEEKSLAHDADGSALAIATSDDHGVLAFARRQKNGSCNLAVMRDDGGDWAFVTEGDTVDGAPSWVPVGPEVTKGRHRLVFQSSGIGRDAAGQLAGLGPSEIHLLDAEHGQLETLVASPTHDYLAPRVVRDGTLLALRRPYRAGPTAPDAATMLRDGLFAPFRLMYAGFRYLDFFSMKYTGKPLAHSGNTKGRHVDARRLLERQNIAAAGETIADEEAMRAPNDWVLVRRDPSGDETIIAKSVVAYDVARDGRILLTDGLHVQRIAADGGSREKLASAKRVVSLAAL